MMQHYKEMCIVLHQDFAKFKNQMIFKVILLFLFSLITLLFVHFLLGILFFLFTIPVIFQHFYALEKKYQRYINAKEIAFYNLYRFLVNMLANKIIVYNALKECLPYIDEVLYADVQQWIENIEQDSSLQPFIEFSNHFSQALIKQMILMLYYAQENGNKTEMLEEMNATILSLQNESIQIEMNNQIKKLETFSAIPLLLSAITIILFSIFIFTTIGVNQLVSSI